MRDKDVDGILAALLPVTSAVVATRAPTARALPAGGARARAWRRCDPAATGPWVERDAGDGASTAALDAAERVCVAGSIFLVGAVRDGLRRRAILP